MTRAERAAKKPRRGAPKSRALFWTDRAIRDLDEIADHIARDNQAAAERWIAILMKTAEHATTIPLAGRRVPEIGRDDVREVFKRTYRIVYRVRDGRVEVLTVFEGRRTFPADIGAEDNQ